MSHSLFVTLVLCGHNYVARSRHHNVCQTWLAEWNGLAVDEENMIARWLKVRLLSLAPDTWRLHDCHDNRWFGDVHSRPTS